MTLKIQIIITVLVIIGLVYIIGLIRKHRLELKYALPWMGAGILVIVFACVPGFMDALSDLIGIASPVNMIFFLGFLFALVIILALTVAVSSAANGVKMLVQQLAILEKRNRELEERIKELSDEKK